MAECSTAPQVAANGSSPQQPAATYSVAESAQILGIPTRTLHQWIRDGKISTQEPALGERGARLAAATVENLRAVRAAAGSSSEQHAAGGSTAQQPAANGSSSAQQVAAGLSPNATPSENLREILDRADAERDRQAEEIAHLRAQLDRRGEEIQRRDHAEAELRRLLLSAQQLAHELAQQLEQKCLPPAHNDVQPPKGKVRWYWPFGRR